MKKIILLALGFTLLGGVKTTVMAQLKPEEQTPQEIEKIPSKKEQRKIEQKIAEAHKKAEVQKLLNSGEYRIFIERAYSSRLNKPYNEIPGYYYFKVTPTEIESFMPYFGKVYHQPMIVQRSPFDFTTTDFTYTVINELNDNIKEPQEIKITVRRSTTAMQYDIFIRIFDTGMCSMTISGPSLQGMQFTGTIKNVDYTK